nr:MAG TPA: hypothetical protein [Caudoviricetes sp.]
MLNIRGCRRLKNSPSYIMELYTPYPLKRKDHP